MEENKEFIKNEIRFIIFPIVISFLCLILYKLISLTEEIGLLIIISFIFIIMFIYKFIKSIIDMKNKKELTIKEVIGLYIQKEFIKAILVQILFIILSGGIVNDLVVYYMGGLEEYLKYDTLRLFTSYFYINLSIGTSYPMEEYFKYITNYLQIELYLWIIPFCMAIIYSYLAYWIAHKIVDRSGIGATKRLNFVYFFFIFGISNILSRIFAYDVVLPITGISTSSVIWWYIFYKLIKIGVLKVEEKLKKQGE